MPVQTQGVPRFPNQGSPVWAPKRPPPSSLQNPDIITRLLSFLGNFFTSQSPPNNTTLMASPSLKAHANVTTPTSVMNRQETGALIRGTLRERGIDRGSRPPTPHFTDIGQVGDVSKYVRTADDGGTKSFLSGLGLASQTNNAADLVGLGVEEAADATPAIGDALRIQNAIMDVGNAILGPGNAAGLSPQQLEYIYTGKINGKPVATTIPIQQRLAIAEGRAGTKQLRMPDGSYVTVGGTALGGPGFTMLEDESDAQRGGVPRAARFGRDGGQ